ncbi:translocation/assembly module TamB domain-containing protein [Thalassobaculum sp.]|uniref:translocation/assembly module TamB domain-containing protein n=1 Tax=Thalassobaculum sp. TaxID=2022740 RepID=UPI0032EE2D58
MRRIIVVAALVVLGAPVALALALLVAINTDWGRAHLADAVRSATAAGPVQVEIGRLTGALPGHFRVERLRLSDASGVFAELDRVELAWSPWALLTGTVAIEAITADGGRITRAPVLPDSPAPEPEPARGLSLAFPAPPVAVRLGGLRVAGLQLGEALVGQAATVSAELSASVTGSAATAKGWVEAASQDAAARLDLDLAVVPGDGTLRVELRAHEPAGGVAAGLIGLADRPPLDLVLTGTGTLADWKGRLKGGFGTGAEADMKLGIGSDEAGTRVTVDGTADLAGVLPDEMRTAIGPSPGLGLTIRFAPDGSIALERAAMRTAAGTLEGVARITVDGQPIEADARVRVERLDFLSDIAGVELAGAMAIQLRLVDEGRRVEVSATGSPVVASTPLGGLTIEMSADANTALAGLPESVAWTAAASVETPGLPDVDAPALLGPRIAVRASGTTTGNGQNLRVDGLNVVSDAGLIEATARLSDARKLDLNGTITLTDLARFSEVAGRSLSGSTTLGIDGSVLLDPFDVSAVLDLTADALGLGDPALDRLVGSGPELSAGVTLDAENRLSVHGLTVRMAAAQANGDAELILPDGALDGLIEVAAPDLSVVGRALAVDVSGRGGLSLALGGTLGEPTASASWRLAPLTVQGTRFTELTGSATLAGLPQAPAGRLDLRASSGGEAVTLGAAYAVAGDRLRVDGIALDGAGLKGRGDVAVNLAGPLADGRITLAVPDLGRVGVVAGFPGMTGSLDAQVTLSASDGQSATLSGRVQDLAVDGSTRVSSIILSGVGRSLLSKPSGSLRAEFGEVLQGDDTLLSQGLLTAESDGSTARLALSVNGEGEVPYRVTAGVSAGVGKTPLRISVDNLDAEVADAAFALQQPTRITLGAKPRIDDVALRVDGGTMTGGGRIDPRDLDIKLAVRDLPAALARLADPDLKLTGTIDADLVLSGPVNDPTGRLTMSAPAIRTTDPALADLPPLSATAEARIEKRRLTATMAASVGTGVEAKLAATLGLAAAPVGSPPRLDNTAPQDIKLDVEAALEQLSAYLPLNGGRMAGQASIHVAVAGTPADPVVNGTASLRDGAIDQPAIGLYLEDVRLEANGRGDRLEIETLTASAVSGGTLEGSGGVSFDVDQGMPADLKLAARRLVAVDTDEAEIMLDADLTFTGMRPDYRLAGTVTVLPSEVRIPDQLPPSVVELQVTEVRNGVVVRSPEIKEKDGDAESAGVPITLDIKIDIPGKVFVRGRGLDSEWGGDLTVTGRADDPDVKGGLQVRRGKFDGLGRTFTFERGQVVFDGSPPDDPTLNMALVTEVAEIKAKVLVSGRAQDPTIELASEPAMPKEEVLSHILFGSSRAQLSPLQALKLAQSAAVLSGRLGSGGGITDTIRETLGADTLDVDAGDGAEGSRGASLSVGKYVAPGVFLKLQQGLSGAGSKAVVEVEITDSISVETDVGADSQSRVGVNWKVDY